ncbi:hypothetical protein EBR78_06145 [bacterium]|nr:hypothetical protein [bacterium]
MKRFLFLMVSTAVLLSGCGQNPQSETKSFIQTTCPFEFPQLKECAQIFWTQGPTADGESSFELEFSAEPVAQVGVFLRMTCCGTIKVPSIQKLNSTRYRVTGIQFVPGTWEVYVQLQAGSLTEKSKITLSLND